MKIKQLPEDFIVEEVYEGGISTVSYPFVQKLSDLLPKKKRKFLHCDMVKRNYTSERAVSKVAKSLGISTKRLSYAGTKDKRALTSQRICIRNGDIRRLKIKDIQLKNFRYMDEELKMGDLLGNRFTITLRGIKNVNPDSVQIFIENSKNGIKNYFGEQRFGKRCNNHVIGKRIMQGNFEAAVKLFLTDTGDEPEKSKKARVWLMKNWGDWDGALKRFPSFLGLERRMLEHLKKKDSDFTGAIKRLPKRISLMFIHAYQAHIFNCCLELDDESTELPLVGYNTEVSGVLKEVLEEEGIKVSDFRIKSIPHLSSKGSMRKTRFFPKELRLVELGENMIFTFILDSGIYGTVLIRELANSLGEHVEI